MTATIPFGRIPCWIDDFVAAMRNAERGVYIVLATHVNGRTGEASPSLDRVARLLGIDIRTARHAIRSLEQMGALRVVVAGRGRGRTNRYQLVYEAPPQNRASEGPILRDEKPGPTAHKIGRGRAQNRASGDPPNRENRKNRERARGSPLRSLARGGSRRAPVEPASEEKSAPATSVVCVGGRPSGPSREERYDELIRGLSDGHRSLVAQAWLTCADLIAADPLPGERLFAESAAGELVSIALFESNQSDRQRTGPTMVPHVFPGLSARSSRPSER